MLLLKLKMIVLTAKLSISTLWTEWSIWVHMCAGIFVIEDNTSDVSALDSVQRDSTFLIS